MKPAFRPLLIAIAPLALAACGDSRTEEPPPLPPMEGANADGAQSPADQTASGDQTSDETPDETVVEVEPEVAGTEPMDAGLPMADAAPMGDDFGAEEAPAE